MSHSPDNTVHRGLELPSLAAISHATDDQKNRSDASRQRKRRRQKKRLKSETPQDIADSAQTSAADDEDRPQVDYLA